MPYIKKAALANPLFQARNDGISTGVRCEKEAISQVLTWAEGAAEKVDRFRLAAPQPLNLVPFTNAPAMTDSVEQVEFSVKQVRAMRYFVLRGEV